MNTDNNGKEIKVGDRVSCDQDEEGTITKFGGLGVFVKMDLDQTVIDWAIEQVELT